MKNTKLKPGELCIHYDRFLIVVNHERQYITGLESHWVTCWPTRASWKNIVHYTSQPFNVFTKI